MNIKKLEMDACAKINITLDVLGLRTDGFHEVEMIMQSIDLCDRVSAVTEPSGIITLQADCPGLPLDEQNIMIRAAQLLQCAGKISMGASLNLQKKIPVAAGLGGGSSDGAAALHLLNRLWGLDWPISRLSALGAQLGSDVPFCIQGGTALAWGRGERLKKLPSMENRELLLVKPPFGVSTAEIYRRFDEQKKSPVYQSRRILSGGDAYPFATWFHNDLEPVTVALYPEVGQLIEKINAMGGRGVMTGSGPTVMGIFARPEDLGQAFEYFSGVYPETYRVKTT